MTVDDGIGRWYWTVRRATAPLHRGWLDVTHEDRDNVPAGGPVVLAANHLSFLDSVLLMYSLPRRVSFLGKAEYLEMPVARRLFPAAGMIPVDRDGRDVGRSLTRAADRLAAGEVVGVFPEGTRSRDGRLHRGHPGVAHLALRTGAVIVPVGITGTEAALPPGAHRPRRCPITIRFGAPIDPGRWTTARPTRTTKQALTEEVMDAIAALTGQARSGEFAPRPGPVPSVP